MNTPSPPVVFVDMDHTMIAGNSARMYARALWKDGRISIFQLAKVFYFFIKYRLALIDMVATTERIISGMRGVSEEELRRRCEDIFNREMRDKIYPEMVKRIEAHRKEGAKVVIVTASSDYLVEPIARHLGIDEFLATKTEAVDGVLNGKYVSPVCFGEGKLVWTEAYCQEHGVSLADCVFYTDSYTDLPLLESVGIPIVVNPDPRLKRYARQKDWQVCRFELSD